MSSPLTTDLRDSVAIIMAALMLSALGFWFFLYPAVTPPQELVTIATLSIQFLFGLAGTNIAFKTFRANSAPVFIAETKDDDKANNTSYKRLM